MNTKNNADRLSADALNECFEKMLDGKESIDSCLQRFPNQASELKPLLETMKAAREAISVSPGSEFRARARYDFQCALSEHYAHASRPQISWRLRWATVVSTVGVLVLAGGGSVMAASTGSMPGQVLYQIKRSVEDVQLSLAPSQADKARVYAVLADRRVGELAYAARAGDGALMDELTNQFTADLRLLVAIAAPTRALNFPVSGSSADKNGSFAGQTTTAGTGETVQPMSPPAPTTAQAPGISPGISAPAPQTSLSGITDPVLLKLLQQYSTRNIAELMAILDSVPPSVRDALLNSIETVSSGYGGILGS